MICEISVNVLVIQTMTGLYNIMTKKKEEAVNIKTNQSCEFSVAHLFFKGFSFVLFL